MAELLRHVTSITVLCIFCNQIFWQLRLKSTQVLCIFINVNIWKKFFPVAKVRCQNGSTSFWVNVRLGLFHWPELALRPHFHAPRPYLPVPRVTLPSPPVTSQPPPPGPATFSPECLNPHPRRPTHLERFIDVSLCRHENIYQREMPFCHSCFLCVVC